MGSSLLVIVSFYSSGIMYCSNLCFFFSYLGQQNAVRAGSVFSMGRAIPINMKHCFGFGEGAPIF